MLDSNPIDARSYTIIASVKERPSLDDIQSPEVSRPCLSPWMVMSSVKSRLSTTRAASPHRPVDRRPWMSVASTRIESGRPDGKPQCSQMSRMMSVVSR